MRRNTRLATIGALLFLGLAAPSRGQTFVQGLSFSLTALAQTTETNIQVFRLTTKDVIRLFAGSSVVGGRLLLVTPVGNQAGATGNLNAHMRVTDRQGNIVVEVPTPASFNLTREFSSSIVRGSRATTYSTDEFSIDFNNFHAELQGISKWSSVEALVGGVDLGSAGAFTSTVNGEAQADGVFGAGTPMAGTISTGTPSLVF